MKIYEPDTFVPTNNIVLKFGRTTLLTVRGVGRAILLIFEAYSYLIPHYFLRRREIINQTFTCGIKSIGIVSIVAIFTGMILSLQAGYLLKEYGQAAKVGMLVAETMCREMGPFMTALIVAASVGSGISAGIGTMNVSEEITALQVMSINPASYLVLPRLIALVLMVPVLTIYANLIGIIGGMIVANTQLEVSTVAYYHSAITFLDNKEVYVGLFKSLVFAHIITAVSCYQGFATTNGAIGVGKAARRTVVTCFLLILVTGYFITWMFTS